MGLWQVEQRVSGGRMTQKATGQTRRDTGGHDGSDGTGKGGWGMQTGVLKETRNHNALRDKQLVVNIYQRCRLVPARWIMDHAWWIYVRALVLVCIKKIYKTNRHIVIHPQPHHVDPLLIYKLSTTQRQTNPQSNSNSFAIHPFQADSFGRRVRRSQEINPATSSLYHNSTPFSLLLFSACSSTSMANGVIRCAKSALNSAGMAIA
ncbi:uncharacterized protein MCYG_05633 [Microsporum canis CBS 113480]|uniref:Uncharacterized protein n=1 Tax=Arthroderma otae (strain ATCC MYA-4605 / CBS 113480) TaxID=554155 RepID=C5FSG1_ARTOC|nr:uncharacterized protein MCYG_05633 [Microsporum canis CBS 113480]EEQ32814.1 predicted protein [Microsporum canis CBS 113480]